MCNKNADAEIIEKLRDYPEILIIILNNNKKNKIDFTTNINIGNYEYELLTCITTQDNNNSDYNIFFREELQWYTFNYKNEKEVVVNEIGS